MDVIAKIDQARRECNVLEHPFYQRWSAGTLSERELDVYARQYRHAVVALAQASSLAAQKVAADPACAAHANGLERHAEEESAHVALWDAFAQAASAAAAADSAATAGALGVAGAAASGVDEAAASGVADAAEARERTEPFEPTERCARSWTAGDEALEHLAVLYAIEASQPEISKAKLKGLVERYGYQPEGPATEYFRLHATLDVEHARQARELIERLMSAGPAEREVQCERMAACAKAALSGNWTLLDGVEARCGHGA